MSVYENDFDAMPPILITEHTCEFSDIDEKLNKVKFTWRHSANRPLMEAPLTADIFDNKFNPLIPDSSLDTHIYRPHYAHFFGRAKAFCKQNDDRRPCRYFRLEIRRLYPETA